MMDREKRYGQLGRRRGTGHLPSRCAKQIGGSGVTRDISEHCCFRGGSKRLRFAALVSLILQVLIAGLQQEGIPAIGSSPKFSSKLKKVKALFTSCLPCTHHRSKSSPNGQDRKNSSSSSLSSSLSSLNGQDRWNSSFVSSSSSSSSFPHRRHRRISSSSSSSSSSPSLISLYIAEEAPLPPYLCRPDFFDFYRELKKKNTSLYRIAIEDPILSLDEYDHPLYKALRMFKRTGSVPPDDDFAVATHSAPPPDNDFAVAADKPPSYESIDSSHPPPASESKKHATGLRGALQRLKARVTEGTSH